MSLSTIITRLSEFTGIKDTNTASRAQLVRYINTAGREIWNTRDLPGSTFEQYFTLPVNPPDATVSITQITLPWYCQGVRAIRWTPAGQRLTLQDLYPRYHATPWRLPLLTWRIKGTVPLTTAMTQDGQLQFSLAEAQDEQVTITIEGPVAGAANGREDLVINVGATDVLSTQQWLAPGPTRITKNRITTHDVQIFAADGTTALGIIPNRQENAANLLVQIGEDGDNYGTTLAGNIEVLYKLPYQELYFDTDVFLSADYEEVLVWRAKANWEALKTDDGSLQRAAAMADKADTLIAQLSANSESATQKTANFAPAYQYTASRYMQRGTRFNYGWGHLYGNR